MVYFKTTRIKGTIFKYNNGIFYYQTHNNNIWNQSWITSMTMQQIQSLNLKEITSDEARLELN